MDQAGKPLMVAILYHHAIKAQSVRIVIGLHEI